MTTSDKSGSIAVRAYSLLRKNTEGWRIDSAGFWSYPALAADPSGKPLWIFAILQAVPMPEKKRTALFRPKAIVVTSSSGTEIVRYENLRTGHDPFPKQDWTKPIAMFPHKSVGSLTMKEFEKREAELFQAYPGAEAEFMKTKKLPAAFVRQYLELAHPAFLPFIKPLAPQFFAALGVEKP